MNNTQSALLVTAVLVGAPLLFGAKGGCGKSESSATDAGRSDSHSSKGDAATSSAGSAAPTAGGHDSAGMGAATGGSHASGSSGSGSGTGTGGSHASGGSGAGSGGAVAKDAGQTMPKDAGTPSGGCVSKAGEHCGGNIKDPCTCASGLVCTPAKGGPPAGDVGGTCQAGAQTSKCSTDKDCALAADYCTGCDCVALAPGEKIKECSGPGVRCFADPCLNKSAACNNGMCVAK